MYYIIFFLKQVINNIFPITSILNKTLKIIFFNVRNRILNLIKNSKRNSLWPIGNTKY